MKSFNEWRENQYYGLDEEMPYYVMLQNDGGYSVYRPYPFAWSSKLTLSKFGASDTDIGKHLFDAWLDHVKSKGNKVFKVEPKDVSDNADKSWELKTHPNKLEKM